MPSVIRLLPRKKIERHVVPYTKLLSMVFTKRLIMAARILLLLNVLLALAVKPFVKTSFMRVWLCLTAVSACCLVLFKTQFVAEPRAYASAATELLYKLMAKSSWVTFLGFASSMALYFYGVLAPSTPYYSVRKATSRPLPQGIPHSLALHRTDQWYVLNEKFQYAVSFAAALVIVHTICFVACDGSFLRLDASESGLAPMSRLLRRVPAIKRSLISWASCACAWPLVYFAAIRSSRWSPLQIAGTVTLSGFRLPYLLIPVVYLPLSILWVASYEVLTAYLSLGPIYKGKPLTEAAQGDKNGSLVDGVSRKPGSITSLTAWYELLVIAEHYDDRRKSIFNDVDSDRVLWDQLHQKFTQLLSHKTTALKPKEKKPQHVPVRAKQEHPARASILPLANKRQLQEERLVVQRKSQQLYKPESALEKKLASFAHQLESESTSRANKAYLYLKKWHKYLTSIAAERCEKLLATRLGAAFRKTVPRKLAMMLPHRQETAFAARAMARMTTRSIKEDENGFVQGTIASTLGTLDKLASELESLVAHPPVHGSDVLVKHHVVPADTSIAKSYLGEINAAFIEIVEVFEPYFKNLNIGKQVQERIRRMHKSELETADTAWLL